MRALARFGLCLVLSAAAAGAVAGCGGATRLYEPVAQHTLRSGPETDTDVIWVQQYDGTGVTTLLRCAAGPGGPVCQPVTN